MWPICLLARCRRDTGAASLLVYAAACSGSQTVAARDGVVAVAEHQDGPRVVQVLVRNTSPQPLYLQTVGGRLDVLFMIRVGRPGEGAWSEHGLYREGEPVPPVAVRRLEPDSAITGTYQLPSGEYKLLVLYGDRADSIGGHGLWLPPFAVR